MNVPQRLLAKRADSNELTNDSPATLLGHLQSVFAAAEVIVVGTGADQLEAVGLIDDEWLQRLGCVVPLAAALHDLGKANDHFQRMVQANSRKRQGLRHEWVAYWLCQQKPWCEWGPKVAGSEEDWRIVLWAIAGHHPAMRRPSPPQEKPDECGDIDMTLFATHPDFRACVEWLENTFENGLLPAAVPETDLVLNLVGHGESAFSITTSSQTDPTWHRFRRNVPMRRFVAVVKAALLTADVAGSWSGQQTLKGNAADDEQPAPLEQIQSGLAVRPEPDELEGLVQIRLDGKPEREFQTEVGVSSHRVTLVKAGCGSGKTAAAYLWAARAWPGRRLYFCYPTTGTATEGFRDYLFDDAEQIPRLGSRLFHSRAAVDAELILHADEADAHADPEERWHRADALSAWSTPVVCCTVDRVLGLLQNWRTGLMTWPVLAQSAFVFDEIHAYDNRMFGLLLRFLRECAGLPVLLMTASLPEPRRAAILEVLHRKGELLHEIDGPRELEERPRYQRQFIDDAESLIVDEVSRGGRVLQVCNTVDRAMHAADALRQFGLDPMIYHSRFRYCDRVEQHKRVINAFKPPSRECSTQSGAVAVCTQVAEMSLDLQAATLLVSDLCPVPNLIQRLGRLNRGAAQGDPTRPFVIVEPTGKDGQFTPMPYGQSDDEFGDWPTDTRTWLDSLGTGPISQRQLADAWQSQATAAVPVYAACCWLDGGPTTSVDAVRDGSYGQTVLLGSDRADVARGRKRVAEVALPMPPIPKRFQSETLQRLKGLLVIPDSMITYSPLLGAAWNN